MRQRVDGRSSFRRNIIGSHENQVNLSRRGVATAKAQGDQLIGRFDPLRSHSWLLHCRCNDEADRLLMSLKPTFVRRWGRPNSSSTFSLNWAVHFVRLTASRGCSRNSAGSCKCNIGLYFTSPPPLSTSFFADLATQRKPWSSSIKPH